MRAGGGKTKGSAFERKVCVDLSHWISGNFRDDLFWRSAMSGGRATVGKKQGINRRTQMGDITAIAGDSIFARRAAILQERAIIECKCLKTIQLEKLIYEREGAVVDALRQIEELGDIRAPVVIAKQDRKPALIISSQVFFYQHGAYPTIYFPRWESLLSIGDGAVCMMKFDTFLAVADPATLDH